MVVFDGNDSDEFPGFVMKLSLKSLQFKYQVRHDQCLTWVVFIVPTAAQGREQDSHTRLQFASYYTAQDPNYYQGAYEP